MTAPAPTPPTFTQRPWVTAGVALTAAGMVAAAPVTVPDLPQFDFAEIELTAGLDDLNPIPGWVDVFSNSAANIRGLFDVMPGTPFPIIQQVLANQAGYVTSILNGGDIGTVFSQIGDNFSNAIAAPFLAGDLSDAPVQWSGAAGQLIDWLVDLIGIDLSHQSIFDAISPVAGAIPIVGPLFGFTASPASGLLLGSVGPIVGPGIVFGEGISHAFNDLFSASDPLHALADLINLPSGMANAFLNGGEVLDAAPVLDSLLGQVPLFEQLSDILSIDTLGFEMGGVLSGPGALFDAFTMGGSLLPNLQDNYPALATVLQILGLDDTSLVSFLLPGEDVGALGTALTLPQIVADAISNDGSLALAHWDLLADLPFASDISGAMTAGLDQIGDLFTGFGDMVNQLGGMLDVTDLAGLLGIDTFGNLMLSIPQLLLSMLF